MSTIVKEYSRRETDGFAEERSLERKKGGSIGLDLKFETNLTPFAMDRNKKEYVVFSLPRKSFNIYVWVLIDDRYKDLEVRLLTVNGLLSLTGAKLDVSGRFPEEAINRALSILKSFDSFELLALILRFYEGMNIQDEKSIVCEDHAFLKEVKRVKSENKGLFLG